MSIFRTAGDVAITLVGCLMIASALVDAFKVVLLPRAPRERSRYVRFFFRFNWAIWAQLARPIQMRHPKPVKSTKVPLLNALLALLVARHGWMSNALADRASRPVS